MKYSVGQKLICVGYPPDDHVYDRGPFNFEKSYTLLKIYKIFKCFTESPTFNHSTNKHGPCYNVSHNFSKDDYGWAMSEKEIDLFFRAIKK